MALHHSDLSLLAHSTIMFHHTVSLGVISKYILPRSMIYQYEAVIGKKPVWSDFGRSVCHTLSPSRERLDPPPCEWLMPCSLTRVLRRQSSFDVCEPKQKSNVPKKSSRWWRRESCLAAWPSVYTHTGPLGSPASRWLSSALVFRRVQPRCHTSHPPPPTRAEDWGGVWAGADVREQSDNKIWVIVSDRKMRRNIEENQDKCATSWNQ